MYSKQDKANIPPNAQRYVSQLAATFTGAEQFTPQILFEEGDKGAHELCGEIRRKMEERLVIDNWIKLWTPLLSKTTCDVKEA